jgi:hypothetical protein
MSGVAQMEKRAAGDPGTPPTRQSKADGAYIPKCAYIPKRKPQSCKNNKITSMKQFVNAHHRS